MATPEYYAPLVAKWPSIVGASTALKLVAINVLTVQISAKKPMLSPTDIVNCIDFADLMGLTLLQLGQLQVLLTATQIDVSIGSPTRLGLQTLFSGKSATLANITALVDPYDKPTMLWWQATVAQGGGGLTSPVSIDDLAAAGGLT